MIINNAENIVLESEILDEPRMNFNRVLQRLFKNMLDSASTEGSITLKLDVSMEVDYIPNHDPAIPGESRKIWIPSFKHKVSSTITVKDELSGKKNPDMELIWDEDLQMYMLAYISNTDQRTIFDKDAPWNQDHKSESPILETDPQKAWMKMDLLPGEVADEGALPGESEDPDNGAVDGDFKEVEDDIGETSVEESEIGADSCNDLEDDGYGYEDPGEENLSDEEE